MTINEFAPIAMALSTAYPSRYFLQTTEQVELWFSFLSDLDGKLLNNVVMGYISSEEDRPTIASIRKAYAEASGDINDDWGKAWESVCKAIGMFGYTREDEACEYIKDPIGVSAVKRIGWMNLCISENQMSDRANFRDIYTMLANRKKKDATIPEAVRSVLLASKKTESLPTMEIPKLEIMEDERKPVAEYPKWLKEHFEKKGE